MTDGMKPTTPYLRDYTEEALNGKLCGLHKIACYTREDVGLGITKVSYKVVRSAGAYALTALGGILTLGICATVFAIYDANSSLQNYYFDSSTQELLSTNYNEAKNKKIALQKKQSEAAKNEEAEKLNREGCDCWKQNNFEKSKELFEKAYQKCTAGYKSKVILKGNFLYAQSKIKEIQKAQERKKAEEARKLIEAMKLDEARKLEEARKLKEDAINAEAEKLNREGCDCWKQNNFEKSKELFEKAYQKCTAGYKSKVILKGNFLYAQSKIEEIQKAQERKKAEEARKLVEARKLKEAWILVEARKIDEARKLGELEKLTENAINAAAERKAKMDRRREELKKAEEAKKLEEAHLAEKNRLVKKSRKFEEISKLFLEGKHLWDEAFEEEANGNSEKAEFLFDKALSIFERSDTLGNVASEFKELAQLKIVGNKKFNTGMSLQDEGNKILNLNLEGALRKYKSAKQNFEFAKVKFTLGASKGDVRFDECKSIVENALLELNQVIASVTCNPICETLARLRVREKASEKGVEGQVGLPYQIKKNEVAVMDA